MSPRVVRLVEGRVIMTIKAGRKIEIEVGGNRQGDGDGKGDGGPESLRRQHIATNHRARFIASINTHNHKKKPGSSPHNLSDLIMYYQVG